MTSNQPSNRYNRKEREDSLLFLIAEKLTCRILHSLAQSRQKNLLTFIFNLQQGLHFILIFSSIFKYRASSSTTATTWLFIITIDIFIDLLINLQQQQILKALTFYSSSIFYNKICSKKPPHLQYHNFTLSESESTTTLVHKNTEEEEMPSNQKYGLNRTWIEETPDFSQV